MHTALYLAALASVAYSQLINLDAIAQDFAPPELVKAPLNVESDIPPTSTPNAITPLQSVSAKKRDVVEKRDGDCTPYPAGSGPVPSPDTPSAFLSDQDFATMANAAPTPDGYALVFNNLSASLQASNYMGLYTLTSYDTLTCASKCDQANCSAFNVYLERDPSLNASAQNCPNPPSTTNYKCTLWGAPVSAAEATNTGQYQDSFQVVIAGSNGYNKDSPPPPVSCYSGPQELGGAINAPPSSGSYMGYQYFPFSQSQGYDPQTCADACDAQTLYDSQHPAADGSFMPCVFFNAYVLSENAIPQGLYCSMYNETWDPSYGVNYGQYRGSDRYTVSESYSYSKTCNNPNQPLVSSISSSMPISSATSVASSSASPSTSSAASLLSSSSAVTTASSVSSSTTITPTTSSATSTASSTFSPPSSSAASSILSSSAVTTIPSVGSSTRSPLTSTSVSSYIPNPNCDPVPNNLVLNGNFECGLAPWVVTQGTFGTAGIASSYYFQYYGPGYLNAGSPIPSVKQQIAITVGQAYTLSFRTYFAYCTGSSTIVTPFGTITDCQFTAGIAHVNTVNFIAKASSLVLEFDFEDTDHNGFYQTMQISEVSVVPAPALLSSLLATTTASTAATAATSACNTASPVIQNGGFESGSLSPWVATGTVGSSSGSVVSGGSSYFAGSGSSYSGGNYAFSANLQTPNSPYGNGAVTQILKQTLNTCPGTTYTITADYNFVSIGGTCSVTLQGSLVVKSPPSATGVWQRMTSTFVATTTADLVSFALTCSTPGTIEVDSVNITKTITS